MTTPNAVFDEVAVFASRAREATAAGAQAFDRLLAAAEHSDSGQTERIARFVAACYNGQAFPLDVYDLRCVDIALSDDMLTCLDALRWAKVDLHTLVPEGDARVRRVISNAGLQWPNAD